MATVSGRVRDRSEQSRCHGADGFVNVQSSRKSSDPRDTRPDIGFEQFRWPLHFAVSKWQAHRPTEPVRSLLNSIRVPSGDQPMTRSFALCTTAGISRLPSNGEDELVALLSGVIAAIERGKLVRQGGVPPWGPALCGSTMSERKVSTHEKNWETNRSSESHEGFRSKSLASRHRRKSSTQESRDFGHECGDVVA